MICVSKDDELLAASERVTRTAAVTDRLYSFDLQQRDAGKIVIGVDEAGRGPLAGPVVAAAVLLDAAYPIEGINDSKKLSGKKRELLYEIIVNHALGWAVGVVSSDVIDRINILQATFAAMSEAVSGINRAWDISLIDGDKTIPGLPFHRQRPIVGGDAVSASIAAASILAKVTRDRIMVEFDRQYPVYGFGRHKGYGTTQHMDSIMRHGLCPIHRKTFCGKLTLQTQLSL